MQTITGVLAEGRLVVCRFFLISTSRIDRCRAEVQCRRSSYMCAQRREGTNRRLERRNVGVAAVRPPTELAGVWHGGTDSENRSWAAPDSPAWVTPTRFFLLFIISVFMTHVSLHVSAVSCSMDVRRDDGLAYPSKLTSDERRGSKETWRTEHEDPERWRTLASDGATCFFRSCPTTRVRRSPSPSP